MSCLDSSLGRSGLVKAEWFTKVSLTWLAFVGLGKVLFKASPETPLVRVGLSWFSLSLCSLQSAMCYCAGGCHMRGGLQALTKQDRRTPNPLTFLLDQLIKYADMSLHSAGMLVHVQLFATTPWTIALQAPQAKTNCTAEPRFKICRCRPSFLVGTATKS